MLFLVPNFITKSTEIYLRSLGFNNIFVADFLNEYNFKETNLILSILKSGDFRKIQTWLFNRRFYMFIFCR